MFRDAKWYGFVPFTFGVSDGTLLTMDVRPDVVGFVKPVGALTPQNDWFTVLLKEYKPEASNHWQDCYDLYVSHESPIVCTLRLDGRSVIVCCLQHSSESR